MNEITILEKIREIYQNALINKLVGIYVHGSIAFQCFNWDKSDIDFLVVVKEPLTQQEKETIISELLILDKSCPPKGLEMSVILESVCRPFQYPTPYELHFSNSHKERFQENLVEYCREMNGLDKDLAAHIMVINQVGITLCGKDKNQVFGPVSKKDYIDSIMYDIMEVQEEILDNPVYFILNLCRVLAYLEKDLVLSKKQGGEWGLTRTPNVYHDILRNALKAYQSDAKFILNMDTIKNAQDFAEYILKRINS